MLFFKKSRNNQYFKLKYLFKMPLLSLFVASTIFIAVSCKSRPEITTAGGEIPDLSDPSGNPPTAQAEDVKSMQLRDAAFEGQTEGVKQLLKENITVDARDEDGRTALMLASYNGHSDIAALLLNVGSEVDLADGMGRTALMYASTGAFSETVRLLLDHHADPNLTDSGDHFTALMYAAAEGQTGVVRILLEHHADPSMKDVDGDQALNFALKNEHSEVAELLKNWK